MTTPMTTQFCASCGELFREGQKCARCQPAPLFCVPCAARNLHDVNGQPVTRADYIIGGQSMCGVCALPHLYAAAQRRYYAKPVRERIDDAQPLFNALDDARTDAGRPSVRTLAGAFAARDYPISSSTIHDWLTGKRIPPRAAIEVFADLFSADKDELLALWKASF